MLVDTHLQACIDECVHCHATCTTSIYYCLEKGGRFAHPSNIRLLQDCAEICHVCADFMLRESDLHPKMCGLCAEACDRCARMCEEIGRDDAILKECAKTCHQCAESCHEMSLQGE